GKKPSSSIAPSGLGSGAFIIPLERFWYIKVTGAACRLASSSVSAQTTCTDKIVSGEVIPVRPSDGLKWLLYDWMISLVPDWLIKPAKTYRRPRWAAAEALQELDPSR